MMLGRKAKLKELRARLANLTETERQALANRGIVATVEGRTLSRHNSILVYLQSNGILPTIVGGYQQWRKAGKQVKKGEHGYIIWFPAGKKDEDTGDIIEIETYYIGTVFDISQTQEINAS